MTREELLEKLEMELFLPAWSGPEPWMQKPVGPEPSTFDEAIRRARGVEETCPQ